MALQKLCYNFILAHSTVQYVCVLLLRPWCLSKPTDPEAVRRVQVQFLLQVFGCPGTQPVEDVVVPLVVTLHANPRLLQQVM